jgi:uncharacterized membrane protein YeiH
MSLLYFFQLIGGAVFAASGALAAGRKRMDLLGVLVIATATAIGGGTLRDLLLDRHPVFWIAQPTFVIVSILAALLTLAYARYRRFPQDSLLVADALGLALFTILGAQVAEGEGAGRLVVGLMGTITGVAGGVIRDVLSAEVPVILKKGELYASASITGVTLYLVLSAASVAPWIAGPLGMATIAGLRLAAIYWGLHLPVVPIRED